ncbi:hypothetical protein CVO74_06535 [Xanthomonas prunicola]|uniref:Uncharacterized protein n=1 Tax=Xanthomonas prunicola TaxID=2053930 RepID=A0A2N3RHD0_9XANT|nr:hypothetical protein XpruCFBP8353_13575 [Xanthomonas prunicola]PKV16189.1 hypothetical protein XpruCFBP8354_13560 [Xanthomonas prunicola]PKV22854.1 hypothetical protein CVO74_06535 [Xanthomonas prunicola]
MRGRESGIGNRESGIENRKSRGTGASRRDPQGAWLLRFPIPRRQANCLRKRTSFSKKARRSLTP